MPKNKGKFHKIFLLLNVIIAYEVDDFMLKIRYFLSAFCVVTR